MSRKTHRKGASRPGQPGRGRGKRLWQAMGRRATQTPGEALAATDLAATRPSIHVIAFGPDGFEERDVVEPAELSGFLQRWPVTWVDVAGLGDPATIERIGAVFGLHGLAVEDVLNTHQRPKLEPYEKHVYLVMRMVAMAEQLETEQVSLFLGDRFVVTFQEDRPGDCFGGLRERLRSNTGPLRQKGADRLAHALLDAVVDAHFPVLEALGDRLEALEASILERPEDVGVRGIMALRRELLMLRRIAWPTRDALGAFLRDDLAVVRPETRPYLRDAHDHAVQVMDLVETYREVGSGLMEIYLSSVSNRLNEVMKVLTIIATIFIPLSFIASVYGMNFDRAASPWNMPELGWRLGYPFALALMAGVASIFLWWFRKRGWLGGRRRPS